MDEADELRGLDIIKHNEPAYPKGCNSGFRKVSCHHVIMLSCSDVEILEDQHMQSPMSMAFYRDEMQNYYASRNVGNQGQNLSNNGK